MSSSSALISPLQLGPLHLKNRVFMAALTRSRSVPTTIPNALNREYYKQRTSAGLIVTEAALVVRQGSEWPNAPGIWSDEHVEGWKKIVDVVHEDGTPIFLQLWHGGRVSHPDMPEQIASGNPVYAPSAIAAKGGKFRLLPGSPGYVTPTEVPDPSTIVELFRQGAINAKRAGFDGIELHGAFGYLFQQFLDYSANQRTDKWGGSAENRARFTLEVLKAVTEVWGPYRVAIKLSPEGGINDLGMPLNDTLETYSYVIKEASKLKLAYICLARHQAAYDTEKRGTPHDLYASYVHIIRETDPNTKVVFNSGFTAEEAEQWVAEGKADAVQFGVLWLSHPDLAKRIQYGKPLDNQGNFLTWYGQGRDEVAEREGYVDYPAAVYE